MKTILNPNGKVFEPVTIEIKVESTDDARLLIAMFNNKSAIANLVQKSSICTFDSPSQMTTRIENLFPFSVWTYLYDNSME